MNEAQEQQLQTEAGVWRLPQPAFAHGQIHVALLNSGVPKNTKILMKQIAGKQGTFEAYLGWYTEICLIENLHPVMLTSSLNTTLSNTKKYCVSRSFKHPVVLYLCCAAKPA